MAIQSVIKYEGDNQTLIYKHPDEDFNTLSQLIVHESQEAVFFSDGQALDSFKAGRYTLETGNIPLLSKFKNLLVSGGVSPFHCEVYFVNMVSAMEVVWGTSSMVPVKDPVYGVSYSVGANGSFKVSITDARKLLIKYLGTESKMTTDTVYKYFRDLVSTYVKSYISVELEKYSYNVINQHLVEISEALEAQLKNKIEPFGIEISYFLVSGIKFQDEELEKLKELDYSMAHKKYEAMGDKTATIINNEAMVNTAEAMARSREIQGYTWQQEQQFDVSRSFAENEGFAANPANMMAQVPVAMAMGGMINQTVKQSYQEGAGQPQGTGPASSPPPNDNMSVVGRSVVMSDLTCPQCGEQLQENARFCFMCGYKIPRVAICPNCGSEMAERALFCPMCGERRDK
ncbi:MAG: SPFH domain-containing protein [Lachnospiraceae bacterium]|nr:SPFH domain-containing protein [Lachnospiraceae bacterium]